MKNDENAPATTKPNSEVPARSSVIPEAMAALIAGQHGDPFSVLGPHQVTWQGKAGVSLRVFAPRHKAAWVVYEGQAEPVALPMLDPAGFFELFVPNTQNLGIYTLRLQDDRGNIYETLDPYCFPSILSDFDLHLLGKGEHYQNYERLGAHRLEFQGVSGVSFAVWAPNAERVSVVGDFNLWDGRRYPMRKHPGVGIWDIFIPGIDEGACYKFEIVGPGDRLLPLKADPYGFYFELRPNTAAIVFDLDKYQWQDQQWMENRARFNSFDGPIATYEVHLQSWIRDPHDAERLLDYRELAHKLVSYVKQMGFTHIELLPISEHPFDGSWGYQTLGYFAPTSRFGNPADFMYFIDHCHQNGIGVLIDWVPAHFPKDDHGLRYFDGTHLYEHADPRQGEHPEWGTQIFNYARNEVSNFLLGNAMFWFEKYHIDGVRVDAVASMLYLDYGRKQGEWVPNKYGGHENLDAIDFLKRFNELVHQHFPGVLTIAEESTSFGGVSRPTYLGGLGFSFKWNMGWMNDTLRYMLRDPVFRKYHQNDLTFSLIYAFHENFVLPLSHDEVVHGKGSLLSKMPGDGWQQFANLRLLFGYMYAHPGKKLLFMGAEFGQGQEWRYYQSLDWHLLDYVQHQGIQRFVRDLNRLLTSEPALHQIDFEHTGFQWVDLHDAEASVLAFLRRGKSREQLLLFTCNFTPVVRESYRVGVPHRGYYYELLNSDSDIYWGSNVGNGGGVQAEEIPCHGLPYSLNIRLPPLGILCFKPARIED